MSSYLLRGNLQDPCAICRARSPAARFCTASADRTSFSSQCLQILPNCPIVSCHLCSHFLTNHSTPKTTSHGLLGGTSSAVPYLFWLVRPICRWLRDSSSQLRLTPASNMLLGALSLSFLFVGPDDNILIAARRQVILVSHRGWSYAVTRDEERTLFQRRREASIGSEAEFCQ